MDKRDIFISFIRKFRTIENENLIECIEKGFGIMYEALFYGNQYANTVENAPGKVASMITEEAEDKKKVIKKVKAMKAKK